MGIKNIIGELQVNGSKVLTEGTMPSGGGIIDVTELPKENIDEKSIYRLTTEGAPKVHVNLVGSVTTIPDSMVSQGMSCEVYIVADKDTADMKPSDMDLGILYVYIDESENGIAYANVGGTAIALGAMMFGDTSFDKGWLTTDLASITEAGAYADRGNTYSYYACKDGVWMRLSSKGGAEIINFSVDEMGVVIGIGEEEYTKIIANYQNIILANNQYKLYRCVSKLDGAYWFSYMYSVNSTLNIETLQIWKPDGVVTATLETATVAVTIT